MIINNCLGWDERAPDSGINYKRVDCGKSLNFTFIKAEFGAHEARL